MYHSLFIYCVFNDQFVEFFTMNVLIPYFVSAMFDQELSDKSKVQ